MCGPRNILSWTAYKPMELGGGHILEYGQTRSLQTCTAMSSSRKNVYNDSVLSIWIMAATCISREKCSNHGCCLGEVAVKLTIQAMNPSPAHEITTDVPLETFKRMVCVNPMVAVYHAYGLRGSPTLGWGPRPKTDPP